VRVEVADTGVGISDADRTRLFEAFEQVGDSGRHQEGTGLGLHISHKLIELLGGSIDCDSRLGEGSTFTVELRTS
jgi:two-component system, sensor histidine kinase